MPAPTFFIFESPPPPGFSTIWYILISNSAVWGQGTKQGAFLAPVPYSDHHESEYGFGVARMPYPNWWCCKSLYNSFYNAGIGSHADEFGIISYPGYPIDGNRWSENQSITRYQSIKLVNWYRSIDDQSITTQKPFIDCYLLAKQPRTDVTYATCPISRHFRRDEVGKTNPAQSSYPVARVLELPVARHCLSVSLYRRKKSGKRFHWI